MAGALVFPGGKVDPADRDGRLVPASFRPGRLRATPGRELSAEDEAAFLVAACRETFEEAGILLARGRTTGLPATAPSQRTGGLLDILEREDLELTLDRLVYWAHWITPAMEPRRFDTRFFVAQVPEGQSAAADEREVTESVWMTPVDALAAHARAELFLPPPTQRTLEELSCHDGFEAVRAAAEHRAIPAILPKLTAVDGELCILLPWDPLYAETEGDGLPAAPAGSGPSRIFIRPKVTPP